MRRSLWAMLLCAACTGSDDDGVDTRRPTDGDTGSSESELGDDDVPGDEVDVAPGDDARDDGGEVGETGSTDDAGDTGDGSATDVPLPTGTREACDDLDGDGDGRVGCADPACCRLARCLVEPVCAAPAEAPVAPALDLDARLGLIDRVAFLLEAQGADRSTFTPAHIVVLRGRVTDAEGAPLGGVAVVALGYDDGDWGGVRTRVDGRWDFVGEGGRAFIVRFLKDGFLPVDRRVDLAWGAERTLDDVVLTRLDASATTIDFGSGAPAASHVATTVVDTSGARTATLFFRPATRATMRLPDGAEVALERGTVRATEYTVGARGPLAMPAPLPATSAYTYCAELGFDEAQALDADTVLLDPPAVMWVEDLIGAPVGSGVPTASYDRRTLTWVPADKGRVVAVTTDGIDLDGDGVVEDEAALAAFGIGPDERAATRAPGRYWRVELPHFTPWDHNWPYGPPADARDPDVGEPGTEDDATDDEEDECRDGSVILPYARVLIAPIPVPGTGQSLVWRSDRTPGFAAARDIQVQLSGPSVPASLRAMRWSIDVAGQHASGSEPPAPNRSFTWEWDGRDAYGRAVAGTVAAHVRVEYAYPIVYYPDLATALRTFGRPGLDIGRDASGALVAITPGNRSAITEVVTSTAHTVFLTAPHRPDVARPGLGGWTLSGVHDYDPLHDTVFYGDGSQRRARRRGDRVEHALDAGPHVPIPYHFEVERDGAIVFPDTYNLRIARVAADGTVTTIAGRPPPTIATWWELRDELGEGVPATETYVYFPRSLALAPTPTVPADDDPWFVYAGKHSIRQVSRDGIVTTIAGRRGEDLPPGASIAEHELGAFAGDGGPARDALLCEPDALTYLPDGSLVFIDGGYRLPPDGIIRFDSDGPTSRQCGTPRVRRIAPDGTIDTIAGTGLSVEDYPQQKGDGGPARLADFTELSSLAVAPDGRICVADFGRVRCIHPDGHIDSLVGWFQDGFPTRFEGPAAEVSLGSSFLTLSFDRQGSLWISNGWEILRLSETGSGPWLARVVGDDLRTGMPPRIPGLALQTGVAPRHVVIGPDDLPRFHHDMSSIEGSPFLRLVSPYRADVPLGDSVLFDAGGLRHQFAPDGRHVAALDPLARRTITRNEWTAAGLAAIVDEASGVARLTVERAGDGRAVAIASGLGARTNLTIVDGRLVSIDDGERVHTLGYDPAGMLVTHAIVPHDTDAAPSSTTWTWDARGRLASEVADGVERWRYVAQGADPAGVRTWTETGAGAQARTYRRDKDEAGVVTRTTTVGGLAKTTRARGNEVAKTAASGLVMRYAHGAHPSGGADQKVLARVAVELGSDEAPQTLELQRTFEELGEDGGTRTRSVVMAAGATWSLEVDDALDHAIATRPDGVTSEARWDDDGRLVAVTRGGEPTLDIARDDDARVTTITRAGESLRFDYAGDAARPSAIHAGDATVAVTWDERGRLVSATRPDGVTTTWTPDGDATLVNYIDDDTTRTWRVGATRDGQPTTIAAPDGTTLVARSYDALRRLVSVERGDDYAVTYGYEGAVPVTRTTAEGVIRTTLVPDTDRAARIEHPDGVVVEPTWSGHLVASIRTTFAAGVAATIQRELDWTGALVSESVAALGATSRYAAPRNAVGRLTSSGPLAWTFDAGGRPATATVGDLHEAWTRTDTTEDYRVTSGAGTLLFERVTTYRADRRVATSRERLTTGPTIERRYDYDDAGRLVAVRDAADATIASYGYDGLERVLIDGVACAHDPRGALVAFGATAIEYDAAGLRTADGATSFTYDDEAFLRVVATPSRTIRFAVDGLGQRVARHVDGDPAATRYRVVDQHRPVAELDASGAITWRFLPDTEGGIALAVSQGVVYRVVRDTRGSVRALVDVATGLVALERRYDALGAIVHTTGARTDFPLGFAGGWHDPDTGLVHFGARDYDPRTGLWLQPEPLGLHASPGLWTYADDDPVNRVDPSGRLVEPPKSGLDVLVDGVNALIADLHYFHEDAVTRASELANQPDIKALGGNAVDGLQHCIASCSIADHRDPFLSFAVGAAYEAVGTLGTAGLVVNALVEQIKGNDVPVPWDQLDDSVWDLANNADGYCAAMGGATRGEGCADACGSAALGGRLELRRN